MRDHYLRADDALEALAKEALNAGGWVTSRDGGLTRELTGVSFDIVQTTDPYVTNRKRAASLPAQIAETVWMLAGRDDIEWLSAYIPQAHRFSDDGETWRGAYGPRLRNWPGPSGESVDQFREIVRMLREDPGTRRAVFTIFDPARDLGTDSRDIPCNNWVHFLARNGRLNTHVATRSNDLIWGWSGVNAFAWSVLTQVVAAYADLEPGQISFNVSSLHVYERHFEKAHQIAGDNPVRLWSFTPPVFMPRGADLDTLLAQFFRAESFIRDESVSDADVMDAVKNFPEPMMQSWLAVLAEWWGRPGTLLRAYANTSLFTAAEVSPRRKSKRARSKFVESVDRLHRDKGKAYGTSWRKRGEMFSILPNIARKVDRLGVDGAGDTAADTFVDLAVYLAKYGEFLEGRDGDNFDRIASVLAAVDRATANDPAAETRHGDRIAWIRSVFDDLLTSVTEGSSHADRVDPVKRMLEEAWRCARFQAEREGWSYDGDPS